MFVILFFGEKNHVRHYSEVLLLFFLLKGVDEEMKLHMAGKIVEKAHEAYEKQRKKEEGFQKKCTKLCEMVDSNTQKKIVDSRKKYLLCTKNNALMH